MPRDDDRQPLIRDSRPPNLLNTLARIASLTLQSTANPHLHEDHPAALDLLKQAVEITRPWLHEVRAELEDHQHHMSRSISQQHARGTVSTSRGHTAEDRAIAGFRSHLLSELPKLVPLVAKYVAMSKDRKSDVKRLDFLQVLLAVLEGKVLGAEREIERLQGLFARGEGGRRSRARVRDSERRRNSIPEGEESEWYREREERRGGAREEYYRGDEQSREDVRAEDVDGRRRERRRRHRGGSRRRSESEDEQFSHREERRDHRGRRESRTTINHDRQTQDEAQGNDPPPRGRDFNQMTPEERLRAKERTLAMHKERKAQEGQQATKSSPAKKSTSSRKSASSGTTESIARFPPLPIGVHAPRVEDKGTVPG